MQLTGIDEPSNNQECTDETRKDIEICQALTSAADIQFRRCCPDNRYRHCICNGGRYSGHCRIGKRTGCKWLKKLCILVFFCTDVSRELTTSRKKSKDCFCKILRCILQEITSFHLILDQQQRKGINFILIKIFRYIVEFQFTVKTWLNAYIRRKTPDKPGIPTVVSRNHKISPNSAKRTLQILTKLTRWTIKNHFYSY